LETIFPASHLTGAKTLFKPNKTATSLQHRKKLKEQTERQSKV